MARKGGRRRRGRHSFKIPVVTLAILGGQAAIANASGGTVLEKLAAFGTLYTGITKDGTFAPQFLFAGYAPWLIKGLIRKVARPMGALPRVPFGIPISLS